MKQKLVFILCAFLICSSGVSFLFQPALGQDSNAVDSSVVSTPDDRMPPIVYVLTVDDAIGTVTDDRIKDAMELALDNNAAMLVIRMDTPGGFMNSTQDITKRIMNSRVPICVYVAPSGARAGSAGVYITYAAHVAAMAPSTNIGAAHPVSGGGEQIDSVMNEKVTNDAVAQIKAAARRHGRNAEWAEKAVRESVSITDDEALEMNVVDVIAKDLPDLFEQVDGDTVTMASGALVLEVRDADVREIEISFIYQLLTILTSPGVAFALLSIGGLGIVLELYNPGAILPGVVGGISIILFAYSASMLPINYAGVLLIILAIILFIAEIKVTSYGMLTVGGVISLFLGGLMLVDTVDPNLQVSLRLLIWTAIIVGLVVASVVYLVARAHKNKPFVGHEHLIGTRGEVRSEGMVYLDGALWRIDNEEAFEVGSKVEITEVNGLRVKVKKI